MTFEQLKADETQYVMGTYGRFPIAFDRGEGSQLWDINGKRYIDLGSGIGVCSVGYHHPQLTAAIAEQAGKLMHTSNLFTTAPMVQTAKTLVQASGLGGKVFFANSGAEANEGAIKLARKYSFDKYGKGRSKIITLQNSFHGRTVTTLIATGQDKFHDFFFPFTEGFDYAEAGNLDDVRAKADDTACAILLELIQGEGGVLPMDTAFVKAVEAFCRERDLLLLIDEVQTGIGRTGALFCYEQYNIVPDVVTLAKGLGGGMPIGAVLAAKSCCDVLTPGTHATTFGGTPTVCAAANAVLDVVNNEAFLAEVTRKGDYLTKGILAIGSDKIQGVRGLGLMLGILVEPAARAALVADCLDKGLLVLTAGTGAIRLLPPLTITYAEMDEALSILQTVFQ